jgi:ATPase subunit of ABC transporter with duplicated ATPase domains
VLDACLHGDDPRSGAIHAYEEALRTNDSDAMTSAIQAMDANTAWDYEERFKQILTQLKITDYNQPVKALSGGQVKRVALARLLIDEPQMLILDEPTNHLDMNSKDILKNALLQYTGTLIVVSHDRDFLSGLTDELYEFRDGAVHEFKGDIMEFVQNSAEAPATQTIQEAPKASSASKQAYEQSKERERERRKLQNAVKQKEQEIETLEAAIAEKDGILATGAAQSADFYKEYQSLKEQLEQKMAEWEEAVIAAEQ